MKLRKHVCLEIVVIKIKIFVKDACLEVVKRIYNLAKHIMCFEALDSLDSFLPNRGYFILKLII